MGKIYADSVDIMFDYVIVVLTEDSEVRNLERSPPREEVLLDSTFVLVSEDAWNGAAGNGLGTLFALENASKILGKDIVEEVRGGKSVLIVHTAGKGTRNILTRTCKNKVLIELPKMRILEGVIKQFQEFAIPSRILVTWGDQFLLLANSPEEIRKCAMNTHVLLFGLKTTLTKEITSKYGVQIVKVKCGVGEGCELLDFDDSRNYEVVRKKLQGRDGEGEVMVNMGMFAMSGVLAKHMLKTFSDKLEERKGKFNSDELWELWVSSNRNHEQWLWSRAERLKEQVLEVEPIAVLKSFPLSNRTVWLDFGTNEGYYESVMKTLDDDEAGRRLREFLGVDKSSISVKNGCKVLVLDSVFEGTKFEHGLVKSSVISNSMAKAVHLEHACVMNSKLNRISGKRCVVYNVVDHANIEVEDCFLVDVFHPSEGRIRLKMKIGEEKGDKEKWWISRLLGNDFSLKEVAEMMRGISEDEMKEMKEKLEGVVEALISGDDNEFRKKIDVNKCIPLLRMTMRGDPLVKAFGGKSSLRDVLRNKLKKFVAKPIKLDSFVEDKPWGYELWCASQRNYCKFEMEGVKQKFTLDELIFLSPEEILGDVSVLLRDKFPLIIKIIKADERLSVQVHPDDVYARSLGDTFGKEEAWYVLEASRSAEIYLGFKGSMSIKKFKEAIETETETEDEKFLAHLNEFDARVGDIYHIPAGVIHALGGGTKVYEVSSASERTFRIYDYDRGREIRLKDAMRVLRFDADGFGRNLKKKFSLLHEEEGYEEYKLLTGKKFELRLFKIHPSDGRRLRVFTKGKPQVLTCVGGHLRLRSDSNSNSAEILLTPEETALVPACIKSFELYGDGEVICSFSKI